MRRVLAVCWTVLLLLGLVGSFAEPAAAAAVPVVTRQSASVGPLGARANTLVGRHLRAVTKVRYGTAAATRLVHHGDRRITLRVPRRAKPGVVPISMLRARKWRTVAHYTYVAKPVVTRLSVRRSLLPGGRTVRVTGRYLGTMPKVRFGATAAKITARSASALRVVVPVGLEGSVNVTVVTPGGVSAAASAARFSYVRPPARNSASYTPAAGSVTATGVQWVSGGTDPDAPRSSSENPWIVSVDSAGTVPAVGDRYFLAPGGDVFPSGLAGTTTSIAAQPDGSTRVTISPAGLDDVLEASTIRFSDGPDTSPGAGRQRRASSVEGSIASQASFTGLGPNVFGCKRKSDGAAATFSGEIGLRFERLNRSFYMTQGAHPAIDGWITGSLVSYGKVAVTASITCDLKASWSNANRKPFPLGGGATVSFGPTAEIEISGAGTVSFEQTTRFMYGLSKYDDKPVQYYRIAKQQAAETTGSGSLGVKVSAGLSMQIGILDRVGIEMKAQLYAEGTLSAKSGPARVCADVALGLKLSVGAFLDLWVVRWEATALQLKFEFSALHGCSAKEGPPSASTNPQITSDVLPDATVGESYAVTLTLTDDRLGHWVIVSGAFPPGLTLGPDGTLYGNPTGGIGTSRPVVRFVDESGRTADATLRIRVLPEAGFGGGDIQATLTWNSEADLDLHGIEPDGNEIYFDNSGPSALGGVLDHDANAGCETADAAPAENIHWGSEDASSGEYQFGVVTYDQCGTDDLDWHLVVRVKGQVLIDEHGSGDSDLFVLNYTRDGDARLRSVRDPGRTLQRGRSKAGLR